MPLPRQRIVGLGGFVRSSSDLPDGRVFRRLAELPPTRSTMPLMGLAWRLVHRLEDNPPMLAAWRDAAEFQLTVTAYGLDTVLRRRRSTAVDSGSR